MWAELIAFFLGLSILLYCLLAGADFGAGILELFLGKKKKEEQKELITHAMGPVWEANHMWLILAIVILFNGFPKAYSELSITFHIPLTIMLIGVILRGSAFTFRHYDAIRDRSQNYYSTIFILSSITTPLFLGIIMGGVMSERRIEVGPPEGYFLNYVAPWFNYFSFSIGIFVCILFTFLASVYLIGETQDKELQKVFIRRAQIANLLAVISGAFVFIASATDHFSLIQKFTQDLWALICMLIATLLLFPLWKSLLSHQVVQSRILAASQVGFILMGWFKVQFPILIVNTTQNVPITIYNSAAPDVTLRYLFYALIVGSIIIFPALTYLLNLFKRSH